MRGHAYNIFEMESRFKFEDFFFILQNGWTFYGIEKTKERENQIHEALEFLEESLKKTKWAAGNSITVADFALVASISTFVVFP